MTQAEAELREMRSEVRGLARQVARLTMMLKANMGTLLTLGEAALYTGYAKGYLYKLTANGSLPCYRPTSRRVFIDREELERWIRQSKEGKP